MLISQAKLLTTTNLLFRSDSAIYSGQWEIGLFEHLDKKNYGILAWFQIVLETSYLELNGMMF